METFKESADIALKQRDMDLREKESLSEMVMNIGKLENEERRDSLKALEATAKMELEKEKIDGDHEIKAANIALSNLLSLGTKLKKGE